MRDLVETVIDGILQQERMQQHADRQQAMRAPAKPINQAALHSVGSQLPTEASQHDEELWQASVQFEAIFVQQMMGEMRKTVPHSGFISHGFAEDVHASMMDEAIAQASTRHSQFGLANTIYKQLARTEAESGQQISTQEISMATDKLKMANDLTTEVNKHAD